MVKPGFYRGIVINNVDPENKGHCKVYVPGVFPGAGLTNADILPWAEPVMPLFGGSGLSNEGARFASGGWTTVPNIGSYVWVFFEGNDQNFPRFFAAAQAGDAWMSEHEMQHILSTDNFRITIDENPADADSSMQTTTVDGSKVNQETRARIEIESDAVALDLVIKGDVNILIEGDKFEKITGNRYTEVGGNDTLIIGKNDEVSIGGNKTETVDGNTVETTKGTRKETTLKSKTENVASNKTTLVGGNNNLEAGGSNIHKAGGLHDHL